MIEILVFVGGSLLIAGVAVGFCIALGLGLHAVGFNLVAYSKEDEEA